MAEDDEMISKDLMEKYKKPLKSEDMVKFYQYKELLDQMEQLHDLTDDEKMRLGQAAINKISSVVNVMQRILFKASRDKDAPDEIIIVMIEQLTKLAFAQGGADFVDYSTVSEMEDRMKEGDNE